MATTTEKHYILQNEADQLVRTKDHVNFAGLAGILAELDLSK